jgi:alpha,alpha-trehalose phosphorylase
MRDYDGKLSFDPTRLIDKLRFPLTFRGQRLEVQIEPDHVTYTLHSGSGMTLHHRKQPVHLKVGEPVTLGRE